MYARTICVQSPAYLSTQHQQLHIEKKNGDSFTRPIEDIGYLILDHPQISISIGALQRMIENNVLVIYCNQNHMPMAALYGFENHHIQSQRVRKQISENDRIKNRVWQQVIKWKLENQGRVLEMLGREGRPLFRWKKHVKSGDSTNAEAKASKYYWSEIMSEYVGDFRRNRYGVAPNNLLNYGYAILRAAMTRAICGVGLLPQIGIFHRNKYNAFCLADDLMEPYRPYVDLMVIDFLEQFAELPDNLLPEHKQYMLELMQLNIEMDEKPHPFYTALERTAFSLVECFEGNAKKIKYGKISQASFS